MDTYTQNLLFDVGIFLFSLAICALFSFMETSITAMRLFNIKELQKSTKQYKKFFDMLETRPQYVLMTILIATNMAVLMTGILLQNIVERVFADFDLPQGIGFTVGIAASTIIVSLIGEIIPKSIGQANSSKLSSLLWLANIIFYILSPLANPLLAISNYFAKTKRGKGEDNDNDNIVSEKELRFLINYIEKKGIMESDKVGMLQNIFRMEATYVKEILIPNSNIISVNVTSDVETILKLFADYRFSRLPVFKNNPENIIGIIYQKDLFLHLQLKKGKLDLQSLTKPIIFVPDSLKVSELLKEFKQKVIHMAMVLDEYGSTIGLVTLEDALEEIVGDITDEHDPNASSDKITVIKQHKEWLVDATADLDRLEDYLHIDFKVETAVTLGGFLTEQAQHLPIKGERIYYKNYCFTIEKANTKRIIRVYIKHVENSSKCKNDNESNKNT